MKHRKYKPNLQDFSKLEKHISDPLLTEKKLINDMKFKSEVELYELLFG